MDTTSTTTTAGGWVAIATLLAAGLSNYGIIIPESVIFTAIMGIIALIGIIHLIISHFNVQKLAGIRRQSLQI